VDSFFALSPLRQQSEFFIILIVLLMEGFKESFGNEFCFEEI
jgi:hypothetical protein